MQMGLPQFWHCLSRIPHAVYANRTVARFQKVLTFYLNLDPTVESAAYLLLC